jgi:excisionase family DNA binding protein
MGTENLLTGVEVDRKLNWPDGRSERLARRRVLPHVLLPDGGGRASVTPARIEVVKPQMVAPIALGLRDAARLIGVSDRWLWERAERGEVPSAVIGGRRLFRVSALEEWLKSKEVCGALSAATSTE